MLKLLLCLEQFLSTKDCTINDNVTCQMTHPTFPFGDGWVHTLVP